MKVFMTIILFILVILVTFFGLGPVLFADGVLSERLLTLAVVIIIYLIIYWLYKALMNKYS